MASMIKNTHCLLVLLLVSSAYSTTSSSNSGSATTQHEAIYSFGDGDSSDHLAALIRLPSPKPYTQQGADFESGLNFMTPGATVMSPFSFLKNGIPPPEQSHDSQINTFMNLFYKDCFNHHECGGKNKLLQRSIMFMDQPGFNDYKHAFLHGKTISDASKLVPEVVETIKNSIERLINEAGAKTFLVSGSLPMGCLPGFRSLFPETETDPIDKCHRGLNLFTNLHNDHLWQALEELRLKNPQVQIMYADYYKAFMSILSNHELLGFKTETLMKACSGEEGVLEACSDRASYLHWDGFRLTPEASENLIDTIFSTKGYVFPEFKLAAAAAAKRKLIDNKFATVERNQSKTYERFRNVIRHMIFPLGGDRPMMKLNTNY